MSQYIVIKNDDGRICFPKERQIFTKTEAIREIKTLQKIYPDVKYTVIELGNEYPVELNVDVAVVENMPACNINSVRKDFIVTAMENDDVHKQIHLCTGQNHTYQMTREDAVETAKGLTLKFPNVTYMVTSLRGMIPHGVSVVHKNIYVKGLE